MERHTNRWRQFPGGGCVAAARHAATVLHDADVPRRRCNVPLAGHEARVRRNNGCCCKDSRRYTAPAAARVPNYSTG